MSTGSSGAAGCSSAAAVEALLDRIANGDDAPRRLVQPGYRLVVRESSRRA